jgi:hypothetical protein
MATRNIGVLGDVVELFNCPYPDLEDELTFTLGGFTRNLNVPAVVYALRLWFELLLSKFPEGEAEIMLAAKKLEREIENVDSDERLHPQSRRHCIYCTRYEPGTDFSLVLQQLREMSEARN